MTDSSENAPTSPKAPRDLGSFERKAMRAPTAQLEDILKDGRAKYAPEAIQIIQRVLSERNRNVAPIAGPRTGTGQAETDRVLIQQTDAASGEAEPVEPTNRGNEIDSTPVRATSTGGPARRTDEDPLDFLGVQSSGVQTSRAHRSVEPSVLPPLLMAAGIVSFILGGIAFFYVLENLPDDAAILAVVLLFYHAGFGVLFLAVGKLLNLVNQLVAERSSAPVTIPPPLPGEQPSLGDAHSAAPPLHSRLASWSFALGLFSLLGLGLFTGIPSVICGHIALARITSSSGHLSGRRVAIAGLVLGYLGPVLPLAVAAVYVFLLDGGH